MQLDSATTANIGTVASLNPSAAMVTLLLGAGRWPNVHTHENGRLTGVPAERVGGGEEQGMSIPDIAGRLDA